MFKNFLFSVDHIINLWQQWLQQEHQEQPLMLLVPAGKKGTLVSWVISTTLDEVFADESKNNCLST